MIVDGMEFIVPRAHPLSPALWGLIGTIVGVGLGVIGVVWILMQLQSKGINRVDRDLGKNNQSLQSQGERIARLEGDVSHLESDVSRVEEDTKSDAIGVDARLKRLEDLLIWGRATLGAPSREQISIIGIENPEESEEGAPGEV